MDILFWSIILVIAITALVKSADIFTEYSEKLGLLLGISPFIVGVTIISLCTSLPELITGLVALYTKVPGAITDPTIFVADNIIGSNISNILLVSINRRLSIIACIIQTTRVYFRFLKMTFDNDSRIMKYLTG